MLEGLRRGVGAIATSNTEAARNTTLASRLFSASLTRAGAITRGKKWQETVGGRATRRREVDARIMVESL